MVTVHDLALLRHPEAFPRWHRATGVRALRAGVAAADAVVAVSEFTRDELVELLAVPRERIRVVPNGVDPVFAPDGPAADGDYVLAVGTLEPRKNLGARRRGGTPRGRRAARRGRRGLGRGHGRGLGRRARTTRSSRRSYGAPAVSSIPSLYEGFGLPIARGDGVRHARRDEPRRCDGGGRGRRRGARRPARPGGDRGRHRGGGPATTSSSRSASARAGFTWASRRRPRRGALAGARVSLVVVDADVLGRRADGRRDLRPEPAPRAPRARGRGGASPRGGDAPTGSRPRRRRAAPRSGRPRRSCAWRGRCHAFSAASVRRSSTRSTPCRSAAPCPAVVTIHDLSFEDDALIGRRDGIVFRRVVPRAARAPPAC